MEKEKWGVFNENGLIKSFRTKEDAMEYEEKKKFQFQTCGFYTKEISYDWRGELMPRKQSMMGSSKYEFNPGQLDEDIHINQVRYSKLKEKIHNEIMSNFKNDPFRMDETFSIYLDVLREIKAEWKL